MSTTKAELSEWCAALPTVIAATSLVQLTRYLDDALAEPDVILRQRVEALRDKCLTNFADQIIKAGRAVRL